MSSARVTFEETPPKEEVLRRSVRIRRKNMNRGKKTSIACSNCWISKTACSVKRPCNRCIKRRMVDCCVDRPESNKTLNNTIENDNKHKMDRHKSVSPTTTTNGIFSCIPTFKIDNNLNDITMKSLNTTVKDKKSNKKKRKRRKRKRNNKKESNNNFNQSNVNDNEPTLKKRRLNNDSEHHSVLVQNCTHNDNSTDYSTNNTSTSATIEHNTGVPNTSNTIMKSKDEIFGIQYKTDEKQMQFLNTLAKAATFVENISIEKSHNKPLPLPLDISPSLSISPTIPQPLTPPLPILQLPTMPTYLITDLFIQTQIPIINIPLNTNQMVNMGLNMQCNAFKLPINLS